ncbi:MAG: GTPase [Candidatus Dactylopiibacterium carminicum]|uniref:GTPase n=1 Tax=Candidatus Dactylopiibacterium carminicum TaxID=857335 RepID=A0A272ER71_9RHOO|nr:dynamin family protein [Candidatus Dactylopiibacterium carminicum]KAF7598450.1 GTPase [Candidatus Dactylopiibacterium carminicum]PAS92220.1 MAG: GTPase [Candidatus Dactylopiibacterium carminicum]PAS95735.1 MAG: GTPase [Candidatus Dactylopiibacterium carminicum]PAS97769.1 MAG: GTPase [Candidatus Dactylopiibacterium carminicum]
MALIDSFSAYTHWRNEVGNATQQLRAWLANNDIDDAQTDLRLKCVLDRLREDKLVVAFVAEFSRGKSELINAIFFSHYGNRILPSSAGRTTMCPTELQWEPGQTPAVHLLPIETRNRGESIADLRRVPDEWVLEPINLNDAESLQRAFSRVSETRRVPREEAEALGFPVDERGIEGACPDADGLVEIARWRHAVVQFPHPLLEQGLVIIDTPGLNAIGSEPELTLSLLPSAHAVLFILAADTGVTQSDLLVWQKHVNAGRTQRHGRVVVLNKIDGLWDGLRTDAQIDEEIDRQVRSVADILDVPSEQIFPVSAQKALLAKVSQDQTLLARSRVAELENALSIDLLPTRQQIIRDSTLEELGDIILRARELLESRLIGLREQLKELGELRGKNHSVIEYMMRKVRTEKDEFDRGLQKYHAVRTVFTNLSNKVFSHIGMDAVRTETRRTRHAMSDASFSRDLRSAMEDFFETLRTKLRASAQDIKEITAMLEAMYKRFTIEHGLQLTPPSGFSTLRYERDIVRLERAFNEEINTLTSMVTHTKGSLTQRFFETVALEARRTFEVANRDVEQWLRVVMAPLETQVREYQLQLKRRLESVKRVHEATGTLEERIRELLQAESAQLKQLNELDGLRHVAERALGQHIPPTARSRDLAA